jgi:flavin reductase (DIM6/NTAB) family NADH-FMN oxidoreductase RutF
MTAALNLADGPALGPSALAARGLSQVDAQAFRSAMRRLASGVAVVTSGFSGVFNGMTATAICSVSAEPPLVLATINRGSRTYGLIRDAGAFALNLLNEGQDDLAVRFAAASDKSFDAVPHCIGPTGCPLIEGCLATLECVLHSAHDLGTHTLFVGLVVHTDGAPAKPLVYHEGAFARLATECHGT